MLNDVLHALPWSTLALGHGVVTWFLCGLIWVVQVVHYPLFAVVGPERFADYEREHCRRIGRVVLAPMVLEALLATWLWIVAPPALTTIAAIGLALVVALWGSTFLVQVPCHDRLAGGFDAAAARRLVATNWLRTGAWSARGLLAAALLLPQ